ncbi:hypothetical protein L226DRAFT_606920 [Lentinus tigrinus ALCF2SS1-7]|uniref:uncharacterized protein n=1 Tax=Lentinus tigrinus ALCF2SS1-7 TaxID=1328758 RepID=UPI001165CA4B|nr:hypothetical protein L226DRAFT_606920 [Lentinus tigrinus ALCF2SS1-7]
MPGLLLEHITSPSPGSLLDADRPDLDDMERHPGNPNNNPGEGGGAGRTGGKQGGGGRPRRGRSASQPGVQPVAGPSTPRLSEIDFGLMQGGPFGGGMFQVPTGYDEDAIGRALRAMQQDAPANPALAHAPSQLPSHLSQIPMQQLQMPGQQPPMQPQIPGTSPQLTEMFLAALPYLQFLQQQQSPTPVHQPQPQPQRPPHPAQQQPQHTMQHNPFGMPPRPPSQPPRQQTFDFMAPLPPHQQQQQGQVSHSFSAGHFGTLPAPEPGSPAGAMMPPPPPPGQASASNTPSPEANAGFDPTEMEAVAITEDKRRRNTAASARFRIKKKQWTLNLERTISDLSGRVEELEREASELRRENGWLKEIVMLKSKRLAGVVPELEPSPSSAASGSGSGSAGQGSGGTAGPEGARSGTSSRSNSQRGSRESSMDVDRVGKDEKGKGRAQPP